MLWRVRLMRYRVLAIRWRVHAVYWLVIAMLLGALAFAFHRFSELHDRILEAERRRS